MINFFIIKLIIMEVTVLYSSKSFLDEKQSIHIIHPEKIKLLHVYEEIGLKTLIKIYYLMDKLFEFSLLTGKSQPTQTSSNKMFHL